MIKLDLGMWKVEITATSENVYAEDDQATKYFLNLLSTKLYDAGDHEASDGRPATAEESYEMGKAIYDMLKKEGFYENK